MIADDIKVLARNGFNVVQRMDLKIIKNLEHRADDAGFDRQQHKLAVGL